MPATATPLLTPEGLTICDKFRADLGDLCIAASAAGMTTNMIMGQLAMMSAVIMFESKDEADAATAPPPPGTVPSWQPVEMLNGVSNMFFGPGDSVRLVLDALPAAPPADGTTLAQIALGDTGYSLELKWGASTGYTFTANGLWPNLTIYGAAGDTMELTIDTNGYVDALINGQLFYTYLPVLTAPRVVRASGGVVQALVGG